MRSKRPVRFHRDFIKDTKSQVAWVLREERAGEIDALEEGLQEATSLLADLPGVGVLEAADGPLQLRRLLLRRLPFVIWYQLGKSREVWLLRLFHVRQDRPRPAVRK